MANEVLFWQGDKVSALAAGRVLTMDNVGGFVAGTSTLTNNGTQVAAGDTVTVDQEVYTFVAALAEAAATGLFTGTGVAPAAGDFVVVDENTYNFVSALTEAEATGTLTGTGTAPANGDIVTINGVVYTFQTALTNVAGNVHIGGSAAATLTNLFHAINASGGTSGTDYAAACVANPYVIATNPTATTVVLTARAIGTAANAYGTTVASAGTLEVGFGTPTLTGGVNSIANQVVIGTATASLTHLYEAINGGSNIGVDYSSATVASPSVVATNPSATTVALTARVAGSAGNDLVTSANSTVISVGATTLLGGVDSIPYQVVIGGSNTVSMTNLYEAINGATGAGSTFSVATPPHPSVVATNPTGTTVVVTATGEAQLGDSQNTIATTDTSAVLSWGTATITGGLDADVLTDPITGFPRYQTYALATPAAPNVAVAYNLPIGDYGQEVVIYLKTKAGGNAVVAGAFSAGTHLTLSAAGQLAKLKYLGGAWYPLSNTGAIA